MARVDTEVSKREWAHMYTEVDFCACLLLHGWDHNEFSSGYWAEVDKWFQQQWPDRYNSLYKASQPYTKGLQDYEGQMEFKMQYFSWVRKLYHEARQD